MTSKEEEAMFGRKKGPTKQFQHADDCRIVKADPSVEVATGDPPDRIASTRS